MNLYVREITNKLEPFNVKEILRKIKFIKNCLLRKWLKSIIKVIIRLKYDFFYFTGKIEGRFNRNYIECLIPVKENNKEKVTSKWIKNINNVVRNNKIDNVIVSKRLKQIKKLNDSIDLNDKNEGKILLKIMIQDVIKYICNIREERIENQTIFVLVNGYTKENLEFLENLVQCVKSVNIITKNLKKFLMFANRIYEKKDFLITVSNNKRKGLSKARILINIDFSGEIINQYNINRSSIFINLLKDNIYNIKGFSGIFVNGLNIKQSKKNNSICINKFELFNWTDLYESIICNNYNFKYAIEKIKKDKVKINFLIGKSGKIDVNEYTKIA